MAWNPQRLVGHFLSRGFNDLRVAAKTMEDSMGDAKEEATTVGRLLIYKIQTMKHFIKSMNDLLERLAMNGVC